MEERREEKGGDFPTIFLFMACLHDSRMTLIPERVHFIPIYFSGSVYLIPRRKSSHSGMSSFRFSFQNDISFWYHVNTKRISFRDENVSHETIV